MIMKIDFSLEITQQNVERAVASFDEDYFIRDLTPSCALEYILSEACQFDSLDGADILIKNMDSSQKKILLDAFVDAYTNLIKEKIKEQLRN